MFFNPQRLVTTAETASQEPNKFLSTTHLQQHRKSQLPKTSTPKVFSQKINTKPNLPLGNKHKWYQQIKKHVMAHDYFFTAPSYFSIIFAKPKLLFFHAPQKKHKSALFNSNKKS